MATYNGAAFLQAQLDSFASQTRAPNELVICDDGSTDDSVALIERFEAQAPFAVRLNRNSRQLGVAANFDKALSLCDGEIIFLSDQDDVWFPTKIEQMVDALAAAPSAMLAINDQIVADADLNHRGARKSENVRKLGFGLEHFITGCCTAVRREWLSVSLPTPPGVSHDVWLHLLGNLFEVRLFLDEPLQLYRRHGGNASHWLASNIDGVAQSDLFKEYGLKNVSSGWERSKAVQAEAIARLRERREEIRGLGLDERLDGAVAQLLGKTAAIDRRLDILKRPRLQRPPAILAFLLNGGYRYFSGSKSALKDLVRP